MHFNGKWLNSSTEYVVCPFEVMFKNMSNPIRFMSFALIHISSRLSDILMQQFEQLEDTYQSTVVMTFSLPGYGMCTSF